MVGTIKNGISLLRLFGRLHQQCSTEEIKFMTNLAPMSMENSIIFGYSNTMALTRANILKTIKNKRQNRRHMAPWISGKQFASGCK